MSSLYNHRLRYKRIDLKELNCPMCKNALENDVHFVLQCPAFDDLRLNLIPSKYCNKPCNLSLTLSLASKNELMMKNLAIYLFKALNRREIALS